MERQLKLSQNWWEYPVQYVKGVGPKRSLILEKLGIKTSGDLLYHFPRRYEDRSKISPVNEVKIGEIHTIRGKVLALGLTRTYRGYTILRVAIDDGTGVIYATWFNQPYLEKQFLVGSSVYLSGKIDYYGELQIVNPAYEVISDEKEPLQAGCIVPIYPLTKDINQRQLRTILRETLDRLGSSITEFLPFAVRDGHKLMNLPQALKKIHFPEDESEWREARERLIFDEFFLMQLVLARRREAKRQIKGITHRSSGELFQKFKERLPFQLTKAQLRVIDEIRKDMMKTHPMNRLVQGEVGSGKTVVAIGAILTAVESGYQAALMAPTEILAEQHFLTLQRYLLPLGLNVDILTGSVGPDLKADILREIESKECDVVVGTHALLEEKVKFAGLGLVIVDEQHKFGVEQRECLRKKALESCDLLMMTATPIPRSLAMTVFGDLDISTIDELPPGRGDISTYVVSEKERNLIYEFIKDEVTNSRQAYIVYPLIKESDTSDLKAATEMAEHLSRDIFPDMKVGLLHGRMEGKEKERIMRDFKDAKIDILVATTVIEVGIDVPNASVMVIENAEQFGLAQLHQMRGRVGRGDYQSYCILIGKPKTEEAGKRLEVIAGTSDGFEIAEEDLELRGPGEFLGTRQHGMPELKLASISSDMELLETARKEALSLVSCDPELDEPNHKNLKLFLQRRFR